MFVHFLSSYLSTYLQTKLLQNLNCPSNIIQVSSEWGRDEEKKIKLHFSNMHVAYWHDFYLTYALMYGSHHFLLSNYLLALHDLKAGNKVYGYYYTINLGPLYYSLYVIWCNAMDPTLNVSIKFFVSWLNQGTINLPHSKRYWNIQQFLNLSFHCVAI